MPYIPDLSRAQRAFSKTLQNFSFECIGETQTEDELHISQSLKEFGKLIALIEDERDRMVCTHTIQHNQQFAVFRVPFVIFYFLFSLQKKKENIINQYFYYKKT